MIDLESEQVATLKEAVSLIPPIKGHKPLNPKTLYNWATKGKRGILLESVPVGGVLVTSKEAILRFFSALDDERQRRFSDRHAYVESLKPRRSRRTKECAEVRARLAREHGI